VIKHFVMVYEISFWSEELGIIFEAFMNVKTMMCIVSRDNALRSWIEQNICSFSNKYISMLLENFTFEEKYKSDFLSCFCLSCVENSLDRNTRRPRMKRNNPVPRYYF
jgi:hypothetical protein